MFIPSEYEVEKDNNIRDINTIKKKKKKKKKKNLKIY